ncbi:Predicted phosphoadenosine phosphosulfate sulfotransferase [Cedecea neteri]|uniref:Predicted phosphoadenosine phosphosulfate sulfotransferase n=1 Tax=Cedecea neteri TaxID=158822 RepID=A0A2X2T323_9ENTR|nr:Predicted phosphoadenosine phosphosulfate sulfotransferase [Cedecea neteri]
MRKDKKIILDDNVLNASKKRIEWVFDTFNQVCVSFSGGKDSSVLFHLVAEIARRRECQFDVLFIDWEVQFQHTIDHVSRLKQQYSDIVRRFYWVALPLTTVNGVHRASLNGLAGRQAWNGFVSRQKTPLPTQTSSLSIIMA